MQNDSRRVASKAVGPRQSAAMLRDIFEAKHDLSGLVEAYGLTPERLAQWANDPAHREVLRGLCALADLQTQLMLSRFRQLAVSELIRQATAGGDAEATGISPEQARKACVDLLRADLKAANGSGKVVESPADAAARENAELSALRSALFERHGPFDEAREHDAATEDEGGEL